MVQVYAADIQTLQDPRDCPEILDGFTDERREKTLRYRQPEDRKRSLGAGLLLRWVLPRHGAVPGGIYVETGGKPQVEGLCFNLSHSGVWVICAVGEKPVGCDVERIGRAPAKLARRFFHQNEAAYLERCGEGEGDVMFFRFWTMKESYIKMTGEGMRAPLNSIEFILGSGKIQAFREGERLSCHIREYELPGYRVSVCAEEAQFGGDIELVSLCPNS